MRFLPEEELINEQIEEIHALLAKVEQTASPNHIRELFYSLPVYVFTNEEDFKHIDAKPAFLGNSHTPKDIVNLIENIDNFM